MTYDEAVKRFEQHYTELQDEASIKDKISWALYFTMRDAQESYLKRKPCNMICGKFKFAPDECRKCRYNEVTNPLAKQFREKEEAERRAWEGQQGAL